jgi:hypothetical protein
MYSVGRYTDGKIFCGYYYEAIMKVGPAINSGGPREKGMLALWATPGGQGRARRAFVGGQRRRTCALTWRQ